MHRGLYDPIDKLLKKATCNCKANTLYAYELALSKTHAWPLETAFLRLSMSDIFEKLDGFPTHGTKVPQMCMSCRIDFSEVVDKALEDTGGYFDGLCLGKHLISIFHFPK